MRSGQHLRTAGPARALIAVAILAMTGHAGIAQDAAPAAVPEADQAAAPATAIPKPADTAGTEAKPKPSKKAAAKGKSKAPACDGLFEAACKEAGERCAWSGGAPGADGAPAKGVCVTVDKTASKGSKDSCPTMFEALCRETAGCDWTPAAPAGAEGQAAKPGACTFVGKAKKAAAAPKKEAARAAPVPPPPDTFGDQQ